MNLNYDLNLVLLQQQQKTFPRTVYSCPAPNGSCSPIPEAKFVRNLSVFQRAGGEGELK